MTTGTIDLRLRPIKLAFLVLPSDKNSILQAIQINSFLWGGLFNPIIPIYRRTPKNWGDRLAGNIRGKDIVEGYIKAFDPDFMIPLGKLSPTDFQTLNKTFIKPDDIISGMDDDGTPRYGIGLFEILQHLYKKEFKFIRKNPLQIIIPELSKKHYLFLASIFGVLPENLDTIVRKNFDNPLAVERPAVTIRNHFNFYSRNKLFLRRIMMMEIKPLRFNSHHDGQCVFLMDSQNTLDIIDYWNLRAVGWKVLPIARQISRLDSTKSLVTEFINENYIPYRHNQDIFHHTTLLKSRNTTESDLKEFSISLNIPKSEKPGNFRYSIQHWYPRIWDNWARDKDGVNCCRLDVIEQQHDLQTVPEHISIRTVDPPFASRFGGHGTPRFANEVDIRLYGDDGEPYAEVIPEGDESVARSIGAFSLREWRITSDGLVYLSSHTKWKMTLSSPKAENIFMSWLKSKEWSVELSPSGLIAKQMLKQLGGSWGIAILSRPGLIELLNEMSGGRSFQKEAFWGKIHKIANQNKFRPDPKGLLKRLTELKVFRLGVELQCPVCQQHSWHSLSDFDYEVECPTCLKISVIPSHSPDDLKWSYRSYGSFSLPKQAYGVYTVLLTLHFFDRILDGATTPLVSFMAKKKSITIEVDLALFYQKAEFGKQKRELLFVECKTFNRFEKKDVERMKIISKEFPGCVIVFSTLNSKLTQKEKKLIKPLVNQGRKYWKEGRSNNPVLILTANELFSDMSLRQAYSEKGGKHAQFEGRDFDLMRLRPLCDITQQLYLDMISWSDWFHKELEKKHKKTR